MYAVVEIAGIQYQVSKNETLTVPRLQAEVGTTLEFNNILLAGEKDNLQVGAPYLKGKVSAKVVDHGKGDKVLVFHKKRRKGYQKLNGFRPYLSTIEITDINI